MSPSHVALTKTDDPKLKDNKSVSLKSHTMQAARLNPGNVGNVGSLCSCLCHVHPSLIAQA